jgi:hypothetical protein
VNDEDDGDRNLPKSSSDAFNLLPVSGDQHRLDSDLLSVKLACCFAKVVAGVLLSLVKNL